MKNNYWDISEISTIFALLLRCPFKVNMDTECPFAKYRKNLSSEEKFQMAEELSDTERKKLLEHHMKCARSRSVYKWAKKSRQWMEEFPVEIKHPEGPNVY